MHLEGRAGCLDKIKMGFCLGEVGRRVGKTDLKKECNSKKEGGKIEKSFIMIHMLAQCPVNVHTVCRCNCN